ncbi:MAG: glycosyltransferase family 39 protein [bacterium]
MTKTRTQSSLWHISLSKCAALHEHYPYFLITLIVVLALIVRIIALLSLKKSIYFDYLLWDEKLYHAWAVKLAKGAYKSSVVYEFPPLPAYIMALIYKIFTPHHVYFRIFNIIFGVLTCFFIYCIGKELADRTVGLWACLIACVYKPFIFYSIVPLKTSLSLFLFSLALYLSVAQLNNESILKMILLGSIAGLMYSVRGNFIIFIPLLLIIILLHLYKLRAPLRSFVTYTIVFILGLIIPLSPFMIRNYRISDKFRMTISQAGHTLYCGNNLENKDPYYRPVSFASPSPFKQGVQFTIEASRRLNKKLSPQEASSYWIHEVINIALKQPIAYTGKIFLKTLALFNQFEAGDHYSIDFISRFVKFFSFPSFTFCLILPFGMIGIFVNMLHSDKVKALSAIFFFYGLTLILFFTNTRYRLPLLVILIPCAVIGIKDLILFLKCRDFRKLRIALVLCLFFFVIESLPLRGTDTVAYYNTHAIILNSKGFENEALKYWKLSSAMDKSYSAYANLVLAQKYLKKRDIQQAMHYLDKIPDTSFAAAFKYGLRGDFFKARGQLDQALSAYERSLKINSGQRRIWKKLINILNTADKERALQAREKLQYINSFYGKS